MLSSAVVIPEPPRQRTPPSHAPKRKLSQSPSSGSKRPRVLIEELQYDEPQEQRKSPSQARGKDDATSQPSDSWRNAGNVSPPRRKSTAVPGSNTAEEKKRNKRLFGSLLGTLSQTAVKPAHKKRDEIEARQRERIRQQNEEEEEKRRRRKREMDERRRDQQKAWDEEATRQRHQNMRDMAGFLKTKAQPMLYYRPWELWPEEEETIERQKAEVERQIRLELGEDDRMDVSPERRLQSEDSDGQPQQQVADRPSNEEHDGSTKSHEEEKDESASGDDHKARGTSSTENSEDRNGHESTHLEDVQPMRHEDHHGEELVEGQEDDVIY